MRPAATVPNRLSPQPDQAAPIVSGASPHFPGPLAAGNFDQRIVGWLLALATALARLRFTASLPARKAGRAPADAQSVQQLLASSCEPQAASWHQLGVLPSGVGEVLIEYLGDRQEGAVSIGTFQTPPGTHAFLKRGVTQQGMRSLQRQRDNLERLSRDPRLQGYNVQLPEIIAFREDADAVWSVERAVAGIDGRVVLRDPQRRDAAIASACAAIDDLHRRTAGLTTIGEDWIERWVSRPASLLRLPARTLMSHKARVASIDRLVQQLRSYWLGRHIRLGCYHGDFGPGNVLYGLNGRDPMVNGIIDWDRTGWDGPRGYDACLFVLASRRADTGEQIGEIVRELLLSADPRHVDPQTSSFGRYASGLADDPETIHGLLPLTWLKMVSGNIEKSQKKLANRLWSAANIDRVLQLF